MNTIVLKQYDATLWIFQRLRYKEYGGRGITEDEFQELKVLFVSLVHQAKNLMSDFIKHLTGNTVEDIDELIDFAVAKGVIYYPKHWKIMYHGLFKRMEENQMVPKDKRNIFQSYELLKTLNSNLSAWYIVEEETGSACSEDSDLFLRMRGYLSSDAPLVNEYPGISRIEQSAISEEVYRRNAGEYVDYIIEFHRRMRTLMEERGLLYSVALRTETSDSVQGPPWGTEFKNEIERKI